MKRKKDLELKLKKVSQNQLIEQRECVEEYPPSTQKKPLIYLTCLARLLAIELPDLWV